MKGGMKRSGIAYFAPIKTKYVVAALIILQKKKRKWDLIIIANEFCGKNILINSRCFSPEVVFQRLKMLMTNMSVFPDEM